VEKVLSQGEVIGLTNHTTLIARDGRERRIADSGAPILDRDGNTLGVVLVFQDISGKQRMEEEMLKVKKLESVGVLAGGIAHDFNNILTAILGNISMALLDDKLEGKIRKLLTEAEKASLRARDLTRQLLTFSKGGDPIREMASIGEIIRDSADFVLHGSNVSCRYAIADDLWLVAIDRGQISQVIQNLIINARDAMPDGGIIEVTGNNIAAEEIQGQEQEPTPKKSIRITISDSGSGIPEEILDKIFDPYFTTKKKGSGLGLAVSYAIIHKHDGTISVQSIEGKGTIFTIELPVSDKQNPPEKNSASVDTVPQKAGRIMVMDDEEMVREITGSLLTMLGHTVLEAKDGEEAMIVYKRERKAGRPIDLFIIDLTIPGGMGGKEAAQQILALNPDAKIIVASGYSNDPVMAQCRAYGFSAAILKPFQLQEMIDVLNTLLP
jgi:signal transduction histidine kinase/CheY-like chemotaxis protein